MSDRGANDPRLIAALCLNGHLHAHYGQDPNETDAKMLALVERVEVN